MKFVVAVSGGVDSVVLLDMLVRQRIEADCFVDDILVAHFDHGIRPDSAEDARFVEGLARQYGLPFETQREELGPQASKAQARERRYAFLRGVAAHHKGVVVTAHHQDDVLGTIAINFIRGTGWRGLAPFSAPDIQRPLLNRTKSELYDYALTHELEYVEDSTNQTDQYLRNRLRAQLTSLPGSSRQRLIALYESQCQLRSDIEQELTQISEQHQAGLTRSFLRECSAPEAAELLRAYIAQQSGLELTWLAIGRALHEIRTARPGTEHQLGQKVSIWLGRDDIIVGHTRPVI